MPPLRERPEDIPILADHFLESKAKSKNIKRLSEGALTLLRAHSWPGNVRELEHVIEGAVLLSSGDVIEERDLPLYFQRGEQPSAASPPTLPSGALTLEEMERRHIERTLGEQHFNRARTAQVLGISKKTLYLKIKRYGLRVDE